MAAFTLIGSLFLIAIYGNGRFLGAWRLICRWSFATRHPSRPAQAKAR